MEKKFWLWLAAFVLLACGACKQRDNAPRTPLIKPPPFLTSEYTHRDVAYSWEKARVYLPFTDTPTTLEHIPKNKAYPVVIFMHGCWGYDTDEHVNWAKLLTSQGLLVVMPNSLARPHRVPRSCDKIANYHSSSYLPVHEMRLAEIEYARQQIKKQTWFDGKNLLLMGYSEGAIAAVRTPLTGFRGVIATSWTCTHRTYPPLNGIYLPRDTPLLTIAVNGDPWFPTEDVQGDCDQWMHGRPNAKHLALPGQNWLVRLMKRAGRKFFGIPIDHRENHSTSDNEQARQEVVRFIRQVVVTP